MSSSSSRPTDKPPNARALLPPSRRSRVAGGLTAAAALGRFELQVCTECGAVQYPPREACQHCLAVNLKWRPQSGTGELISETMLHHSYEAYFRERLPWRIGMVRLDSGPTVLVHLPAAVSPAPCRVKIVARLDKAGQGALVAVPIGRDIGQGVADVLTDSHLREMLE